MTDSIGRLGRTTNTATGTHDVYEVPADKGARVKLLLRCLAGGSNFRLRINVANVEVATLDVTAGNTVFSTSGQLLNATGTPDSNIDGSAASAVVAMYDQWYFLSAGDKITFTIENNAASTVEVQAVGVEVDS